MCFSPTCWAVDSSGTPWKVGAGLEVAHGKSLWRLLYRPFGRVLHEMKRHRRWNLAGVREAVRMFSWAVQIDGTAGSGRRCSRAASRRTALLRRLAPRGRFTQQGEPASGKRHAAHPRWCAGDPSLSSMASGRARQLGYHKRDRPCVVALVVTPSVSFRAAPQGRFCDGTHSKIWIQRRRTRPPFAPLARGHSGWCFPYAQAGLPRVRRPATCAARDSVSGVS